MLVLVFFLVFMLDYIFTKIGMTMGVIEEGNGLMLWLMRLSFELGFGVRLLMGLLLFLPLYIAYEKKLRVYRVACWILAPILGSVMLMHFYWMIVYGTML